ncbi:MAG TPA: hypothetical protein VIC27_14390, partial [Ktedonobacterales bacterium]
SSAGSLPEIVGDAGLLTPPQDVDALADALLRAMSDEPLRAELVARGYVRVRAFDWDAAARQHLDVYRAVARRR